MKPFVQMSRLALFTVLLTGAVHLFSPAWAQSTPGPEDLRALRFYIQQNETTAITAEIRRLEAEFPGWTPPADLNNLAQSEPTSEVADIYARLGRGDIEGVRRVMQRTKARYPSWQVPSDLARQIELVEAQLAFDRAVNTRNTAAAVRIGGEVPSLFRCDRINNAWNLAELHTSAGSPSRALAAYSQIVRTCTTIPDLVATIEKAEAVTSDAQLTGLTDVAKQRFPAHNATFEKLIRRLLAGRGRGVATAPAPAPAAVAAPAPQRTTTRPTPAPTPRTVVQTTAPVATAAPAAVTSPAYAAPTLSKLPRSGDGRVSQTRTAKEAGNFPVCLARSTRPRSLDIAYERAWCAYSLERPLEAMAYFSAAAQGGLGAVVTRDARFGLTLSMLKYNMTEEASRIAASTDLVESQRREVEIIILDQRGIAAFNDKDYRAAIDYFDALEQLQGNLRRDLAILRGYAWLELGEREQARAQFQLLHDALATDETRTALSAAR